MDVSIPSEFGSKEGKPLLKDAGPSYQSIDNPPTDDVHGDRRESDQFSIVSSYEYTAEAIIYCLKNAHLRGDTDWIGCIENVSGTEEDKWALQIKIRDTLPGYPLTMCEKRQLAQYFKSHKILKKIKRTKEKIRQRKKKVASFLRGFEIELWESKIKRVAAYFGSSVASYFVFLRFLFYLNCFVSILMLVFVSLPQIIPGDYSLSSEITGYFGSLSTSVLFYGAYNDKNIGWYNRPLAYFLTWIFVNLVSFIVIVIRMFVGYYISKRVDQGNEDMFSYRLFTSWDHSITSHEGVYDRQTAIKTEIKELMREVKSNEERFSIHLIWVYMIRFLVNILVICILAGSGYLIYLVAYETVLTTESVPNFILDLVDKYELPVAVSTLKVSIPPILAWLVTLEKYHPRTEIKLNIIRTALFYIGSLVSLVSSLYTVSNECMDSTQNKTLIANVSNFCCWENAVGEEIFKVVLLDLLIFLVGVAIFDGLRAILVKCHVWKKLNFRNFDVTSCLLDLIYGQALIWLGLYFSPFLALVAVIKLYITFYCRYIAVKFFNNPPKKVFRVSRSITFYIFVLLINLFISMFPMIYAVITLVPSFDCGPYRMEQHVYEILTSKIGNLPNWIEDIITFMSTSTIIIPLIIFLGLLALFYKAKTMLHSSIIKELRSQLKHERVVQKRTLFKNVRVSKGVSMASASEIG